MTDTPEPRTVRTEMCAVCRHAELPAAGEHPEADLLLLCHRYPPVPFVAPGDADTPPEVVQAFPAMQPHDWCGEFTPVMVPRLRPVLPPPARPNPSDERSRRPS